MTTKAELADRFKHELALIRAQTVVMEQLEHVNHLYGPDAVKMMVEMLMAAYGLSAATGQEVRLRIKPTGRLRGRPPKER